MSDYTVESVPLGYAPVPPQLVMWQDEDGKPLSGTEIRFWSLLAMHRDLLTARTTAGTVRISEMLGVDRTTAQRAANRLKEAGFLLHEPRRRDPETGEYTPATWTLAINRKPLRYGVIEDAAEPSLEAEGGADADAHHHDASAHNSMMQTRTSHDAHHDAHHDASAHNPNIKKNNEVGKEDNAKAGGSTPPPSDEPLGWHFEEYLRDALQGADVPLTRSKARRYTGEANKLLKEGVEPLELYEACDRVITEWQRVRLSLDDALRDLRNGNQANGKKPKESPAESATDPKVVDYVFANTRNDSIRTREHELRLAMSKHDFASGSAPPWPVEKMLGGADNERWSVLNSLQTLCRRAAREVA